MLGEPCGHWLSFILCARGGNALGLWATQLGDALVTNTGMTLSSSGLQCVVLGNKVSAPSTKEACHSPVYGFGAVSLSQPCFLICKVGIRLLTLKLNEHGFSYNFIR